MKFVRLWPSQLFLVVHPLRRHHVPNRRDPTGWNSLTVVVLVVYNRSQRYSHWYTYTGSSKDLTVSRIKVVWLNRVHQVVIPKRRTTSSTAAARNEIGKLFPKPMLHALPRLVVTGPSRPASESQKTWRASWAILPNDHRFSSGSGSRRLRLRLHLRCLPLLLRLTGSHNHPATTAFYKHRSLNGGFASQPGKKC